MLSLTCLCNRCICNGNDKSFHESQLTGWINVNSILSSISSTAIQPTYFNGLKTWLWKHLPPPFCRKIDFKTSIQSFFIRGYIWMLNKKKRNWKMFQSITVLRIHVIVQSSKHKYSNIQNKIGWQYMQIQFVQSCLFVPYLQNRMSFPVTIFSLSTDAVKLFFLLFFILHRSWFASCFMAQWYQTTSKPWLVHVGVGGINGISKKEARPNRE